MAKKTSKNAAAKAMPSKRRPSPAPPIRFTATLLRPAAAASAEGWTFLILPKAASAKLPSRSQITVKGTLNGGPLLATLGPDGKGGHWLMVDRTLLATAGAPNLAPGDSVILEITPVAPDEEPEPTVPPDLKKALAAAPKSAREAWSDITAAARRDWIKWITSGKRAETRTLRIGKACDMLAGGKRRPCCFDRSGMYDGSLSCPAAETTKSGPTHK